MLSAPGFVVQTWYIERNGSGYFRIELARTRDVRAERLVLATRDLAVYHVALDAEGRDDVRLVARWHAEGGLRICDALLPAAAVPLSDDAKGSV